MKFISWNVNGLRACIQKGFLDRFNELNADFFCLQETKLSEGQLSLELPGYEQYWCYAEKKGYSGTAIFTRHTPLSVRYGLGVEDLDNEGRVITLEYPEFFLVTCYTPNAQRELARIDHRMRWDEAFRNYLKELDGIKPVVLCGDLNVAHKEIDLKNPKSNRGNAGFSDQERQSFQSTLDLGFTDTFRHLHPDAKDRYSWWSYMFKAREKNAGWRIDYFLVSDRIAQTVYRADIHSDIFGSDHCPVSMETDIPCNGGIWSPGSEGDARLSEDSDTALSKGAALAKNARAFAPVLSAVAVLLCIGLLWQPLSRLLSGPDPKDLITVRCLSAEPEWIFTLETPAVAAAGFSENGSTYFMDAFTPFSNNVWVRIDLTAAGRSGWDASWQIRIFPDAPELSSVSLPAGTLHPYYTDLERTQLAGWLYCSTLDQPTRFSLFCGPNESHRSIDLTLLPLVDLNTLSHPMDVTCLYHTVEVFNDHYSGYYDETSPITTLNIGDTFLYAPAPGEGQYPVQDAPFVLYAKPSEQLLQFCQIRQIQIDAEFSDTFASSVVTSPEMPPNDALIIRPVYTDTTLTDLEGWLIYSDQIWLDTIRVSLNCPYNNEVFTVSRSFPLIVFDSTVPADTVIPE